MNFQSLNLLSRCATLLNDWSRHIRAKLLIVEMKGTSSSQNDSLFGCVSVSNRGYPAMSVGWSVHCVDVSGPSQSIFRDLWPFRHMIRVMRRHDLTKIPTYHLFFNFFQLFFQLFSIFFNFFFQLFFNFFSTFLAVQNSSIGGLR